MGGWEDGICDPGWEEGRPPCLPLHTKPQADGVLSCSWFPLFPLLFFFFSFSPPFPGKQPSGDFECRQGGRNPGKENQPSPLPQGSPRAQRLSSGGDRRESLSLSHPPWPLASSQGWTQHCQATVRALGVGLCPDHPTSGMPFSRVSQDLEKLAPTARLTGD